MTGFRWTAKREEAALLVAQDELSNEDIARRMGISRQTLGKWKLQPAFQGRVAALVAAVAEAVKGRGIAERRNRVAALNERWSRLLRVIEERAALYADVPGGRGAGMLVCQIKLVRVSGGEDGESDGPGRRKRRRSGGFVEIAADAVDVGLLKELREHEKQAAQELGQWDSGPADEPEVLVREYVGVILEGV